MTISEAIAIGNQFIREQHGVTGEPSSASLVENDNDKQRFWSLIYDAGLFYPGLADSGAFMDGGDIFVDVVDATGHVSQATSH